MNSTDTNLSESTDSSNVLSVSRKVGRKTSKTSLSESHVKRNQSSTKKNFNLTRDSKELKLFPIFNLPVKNVAIDNISNHKEPLHNKKLKCAGSKVDTIKSDLPIDSAPELLSKVTRENGHTTAKELSVKNYENSIENDGRNSKVSDVLFISNELSLIEIEPAIIETIEYLCSEIKVNVFVDHTPVVIDNSLITNYVDRCVIIDNNVSQASVHNSNNELKLNQKSVHNESKEYKVPNTSVLKDEIVENNLLKAISVENKSMSSEAQIALVQKDEIRCMTLENKLLPDNTNNKVKYSGNSENKSNSTAVQKDKIKCSTLENNLLQVSIKDDSNEIQSNLKRRGKNKSMISKTSLTHIQKDVMTDNTSLNITVKNNLSQVSMDNSSNELKSNKKSGQYKSKTSPASVLKDEICTMLENNLSHIQLNESSSELKSNRKKRGKNKSMSSKTLTTCVEKNEIIENVSKRKQSLRSRGIRNNLISYSEIISPSKISEKRKHKNPMQNEFNVHPIEIACNTANQKSAFDTKVDKDHLQEAKAQKRKRKSVKADLKLFAVFSSTKLKDSKNKSGKRKAKAIEEVDIKNDDAAEINLPSKRKKTKCNLNIDSKNKCSASESICSNSNKNCNCIICVTNGSETKYFNESSEDSDICVLEDSTCLKKIHESTKKSGEKSVCLKVTNKPKLPDIDAICFPLLSHIQACSATFSDTSNKYCIDEISDDIVLPVWKGVIGLIDSDCTQMIKSHKESYTEEAQKIHKLPIITSLTVENDMWTDLAQMSVMKGKYNKDTVADIGSWLLQWKNKFSHSKKAGDSESSSDSDDDFISNGIIISGSPGSGKTSLVYALANKLGFTVLEVNASSCRNGRNISNQLKEACESYHVEGVKVENLNIETIFGDINEKEENNHVDSLKISKTKGIRSFFKADNTSPKQKDVKSLKTKKTIDNFFQVNDMPEQNSKLEREIKVSKEEIKTVSKKCGKYLEKINLKNELNDKSKDKQNLKSKTKAKSSKTENKSESNQSKNISDTINLQNEKNSCKISCLTIILFDDVDVVFEEDEGFWSTVKGFLKISKKPVIFTVSRNLSVVKAILNSDIKIFNMRPVTKEVCVKALKECCKEYSRENTSIDLELLTSQNVCDLRRNILNAQFWSQIPKSVKKVDIKDNYSNDSVPSLVHVNGFLTGDLNFSTDYIRKLLFDSSPHNLLNAILQYQSLGYDILFNNLFSILYNLRSTVCERLWQNLTYEFQKCSSSAKSFSDSEMWKEACELFELKKKALKNGSNSQELCIFADVLSDFSYADTLKGQSCNKFQWLSVSERVKMWTAGLPICSDLCLGIHEDILDIISLIHIYRLRKLHKSTSLKYSDTTDDMQLHLEHSFFHFDKTFAYKTEGDLECISSVLSPSQLLNKTALTLDYLSTIKIMCQIEENRQLNSGKRSGRFLHYFDSISLYIDRKTF